MKMVFILVVVALAGYFLFRSFSSSTRLLKTPTDLQTGLAPWPPDISQLKAHLADIGLPALSTEGVALHTHQHLDIIINGQPLTVPAGIGIGPDDSFISPIHTHDTTGFVHVESPTIQPYTLGQFFDIWGVRLTDTCLGGYCNSSGRSLSLYSNGRSINSHFRSLTLTPHQEIILIYGTPADIPHPVPNSYVFPPDY